MDIQPKTIQILSVEGKKVVKSFDLYRVAGLRRCNYTRWITDTVLTIGEPNKDYFPTPDNIADKYFKNLRRDRKRDRIRFYFDIEFAISLCLVAKRKEALILRQFLIENR